MPVALQPSSRNIQTQTAQLISHTSLNWLTQGYLTNYEHVGTVMQIQWREWWFSQSCRKGHCSSPLPYDVPAKDGPKRWPLNYVRQEGPESRT